MNHVGENESCLNKWMKLGEIHKTWQTNHAKINLKKSHAEMESYENKRLVENK